MPTCRGHHAARCQVIKEAPTLEVILANVRGIPLIEVCLIITS